MRDRHLQLCVAFSFVFAVMMYGTDTRAQTASAEENEWGMVIEKPEINSAPGSLAQGLVTIAVPKESVVGDDVTVFLDLSGAKDVRSALSSNVKKVLSSLRFYAAVPEDYSEDFAKDNNIEALCKKRDDSEDLDAWCDGVAQLEISLEEASDAGKIRVPYTVRIPADATSAAAFFTLSNSAQGDTTDSTLSSAALLYKPPQKKIFAADIHELKLRRSLSAYNFVGWMRNGFQESYDVDVTIASRGTEKIPYTITIVREVDDRADLENSAKNEIASGEKMNQEFFPGIAVPRIGSAAFYARLTYETPDGEKSVVTDKATVSLLPIKEVLSVIGLLLVGFAGLGLFKGLRQRKQLDSTSGDALFEQDSDYDQDPQTRDGHGQEGSFVHKQRAVRENAQHTGYRENVGGQQQRVMGNGVNSDLAIAKSSDYARGESRSVEAQRPPLQSVRLGEQQNRHVSMQAQPTREFNQGRQDQFHTPPKNDGQAIDIDWMREDEGVFADAMRLQERRSNIRVGAFAIVLLGLCVFAAIATLGKTFLFNSSNKDVVSLEDVTTDSVETPIQNQDPVENESDVDDVKDEKNESVKVVEQAVVPEVPEKEVAQEKVVPGSITVQVLNGGSRTGYAGEITQTVAAKQYKALPAKNASQKYKNFIVYHRKGDLVSAQALVDAIGSLSGVVFEESEAVLTKYSADLVVVLGG